MIEDRYWQELLSLIEQQMKGCKVLALSGSLPPKAPQGFYADCCKIAQRSDVPVIMDARGEPLAQAMKYKPLMVKPNRAELGGMFGEQIDHGIIQCCGAKPTARADARLVLHIEGDRSPCWASTSAGLAFSPPSPPRNSPT